jgi:hypothetical protein
MTLMNPHTIALLKRRLEEAERNIQLIRQLLQDDGSAAGEDGASVTVSPAALQDGARIIFGEFDGEHMKGEDTQLYPVPANYASKSKLVEGDGLKLTIEPDGAFIYKQIGPIDRKRVRGIFTTDDQGHYVVRVNDTDYRILLASVTFYELEPGSEVTILLPTDREAHWGAVDNAIKPSVVRATEEDTEDAEST